MAEEGDDIAIGSTERPSLSELPAVVVDRLTAVAKRSETKFAVAGLAVGALLCASVLGRFEPVDPAIAAREDARRAIERLAIVEARLDAALGTGEVAHGGAAEDAPAAPAGEHASPADGHGAEAEGDHGEAAAPAGPVWSYSGATGPDRWSSLAHEYATCSTGTQQSPVDLVGGQVDKALALAFDYKAVSGRIVDNGHTIQVDVGPGSGISVGGHRFELVQFHFHGPSEHTVATRHYPLELHLVHQDEHGKLAVVGVFVEPGGKSNPLAVIVDNLPATPSHAEDLPKTVDVAQFLPQARSSFQYTGSLTTPPCTEGVAWSVLVAPITMGQAQIDVLRARFHGGNSRPIQPINARSLFVEFGTS